ncbi:DUF4421 family protein [Flagellimonas sp.]|uniref:DUF4421 family protein n=1 Tax=Flagellimonas sp. TaxID=2058762 RepID=UPI003BAE4BD0
MGIKFYFIWFLIFPCLLGFSQNRDTVATDSYIKSFPEKFTVRIGLSNTSNSFLITDTETGQRLKLKPNEKTYSGVSFLFRSLELDLGYSPKFISNNQDNEGSKLFTLNFRTFWNQWMQTLDFYAQKGFSAITEDGSVRFPDLRTLKIGGTTAYIFNTKFSFRAVGFQNEWQKKSAGSFVPRFTFYYTRYGLKNAGLESNANSYDVAFGPGYHYNLVIAKNYILGAGATTGIGMNMTSSQIKTNTSVLYEAIFRGALGYNSERFYIGANANVLFLEHNTDRVTRLDDKISFLEFYVGYRFKAPKKWITAADKFNRKFGFDP